MREKIAPGLLLTPQEHIFAGSTVPIIPDESSEWYIPVGMQIGLEASLIQQARKEKGYFNVPVLGMALGVTKSSNEVVGFALSDLTAEGQTIYDPDLRIGVWDAEKKFIRGRSLTLELQQLQRTNRGEDLHLRTEGTHPEFRRRGERL